MTNSTLRKGTNVLLGAGVGVAVALLMAPTSGAQLRREMKRRVKALAGRAGLRFGRENADHAAAEWGRRAGESATEARQRAGGWVRESKERPAAANEPGAQRAQGSAVDLLAEVTRNQLLAIYGIGPVTADKILQGRPYHRVEELVERGIINKATMEYLKRDLLGEKSA